MPSFAATCKGVFCCWYCWLIGLARLRSSSSAQREWPDGVDLEPGALGSQWVRMLAKRGQRTRYAARPASRTAKAQHTPLPWTKPFKVSNRQGRARSVGQGIEKRRVNSHSTLPSQQGAQWSSGGDLLHSALNFLHVVAKRVPDGRRILSIPHPGQAGIVGSQRDTLLPECC